MEVFETIRTRLETREFDPKPVPSDVKREVLEAARLSPSSMNTQHWRFILVDSKEELNKLSELSTTGQWVKNADFAVVVLTDPKVAAHMLDAGRAISYMQLAAWSRGVGSRIYTGFNADAMAKHFGIPANFNITAVLGFGYPAKGVLGKKKRLPLSEVVFHQKFNQKLRT
jgi:nitroreductase